MASNSFGTLFKITTWGESHGKAVGLVIDGCPAGVPISADEITLELQKRAPGRSAFTSPRKESDRVEILSGIFQGETTGAPICMLIANQDVDSQPYEKSKDLLKPGHAQFTYLKKYGRFDYRGSGRASARETACRVAGGAVAKKLLAHHNITVIAYLKQVGAIQAQIESYEDLQEKIHKSLLFCPDAKAEKKIISHLQGAMDENDSMGGMVEFLALSVPEGLGDPVYEKLEAKLAHAMLSLPASKGFEIGSGFGCVSMRGTEHNDLFVKKGGAITTSTNYSGGVLGGISTGMPIIGRVAFKPTSSIKRPQSTVTLTGKKAVLTHSATSRHDPCVAIRAVPVVEAMTALVLVDALLMNQSAKI